MKLPGRIFVPFLCTTVMVPANAAQNCTNEAYKKLHPYECAVSNNTTALLSVGGVAAGAAAAVALLGSSGGGGGSGGSNGASIPTVQTYDYVGGDVADAHLNAVTARPEYALNTNQYNDIRVAYSLARGYTGNGATVAVFDTAADYWHGRAVQNLVTQNVAPNATVTMNPIATSATTFISYAEIGDKFAAARADIFNNSWNVSMAANEVRSRAHIAAITDNNFINQISAAAARDTIFVWAAGNDGNSQSGALSALPRVMPELNGHFINVVAWDSATGTLADFSNACGVTKDYCITAPGAALDTGERVVGGTSFATPIVSGAVAVLREAFPYLSAAEITDILLTTARDLGAPGVDAVYGHGMLDLERATRPVGAALVPVSGGTMQPLNTARVAAPIAHNIKSNNLKLAFFDKYGRAYDTDLNSHISSHTISRAMDRMRDNNKKISMNVGNVELGFKERPFVLGEGFMKADHKGGETFAAFNGRIYLGDVEIQNYAAIGVSNPMPTPESMINNFSALYSTSFAVNAHWHGWHTGIAAIDTIVSGNMYMRLPSGRGADGVITYDTYKIDMATRPALEYSVGYKYLTATFVDNPYGRNEFFVMATRALKF